MKRFSKEWWFWTVVPLVVATAVVGALWFIVSGLIIFLQDC